MKIKKVDVVCSYCGKIAEFIGDDNALHYAIQSETEEHWRNHVPSVRYEWSDVEIG